MRGEKSVAQTMNVDFLGGNGFEVEMDLGKR